MSQRKDRQGTHGFYITKDVLENPEILAADTLTNHGDKSPIIATEP